MPPPFHFFFNYALFYEKVQKFGFFSIFISSMISNIPFYIVAFFYVSKYHSILNEFCITFETTFFLPGCSIFFLKIIRWYKMHKLVNSKGEKHSPRISQFSCVWFRARGKCSFFLNCRVLKNIISSAEKV